MKNYENEEVLELNIKDSSSDEDTNEYSKLDVRDRDDRYGEKDFNEGENRVRDDTLECGGGRVR